MIITKARITQSHMLLEASSFFTSSGVFVEFAAVLGISGVLATVEPSGVLSEVDDAGSSVGIAGVLSEEDDAGSGVVIAGVLSEGDGAVTGVVIAGVLSEGDGSELDSGVEEGWVEASGVGVVLFVVVISDAVAVSAFSMNFILRLSTTLSTLFESYRCEYKLTL